MLKRKEKRVKERYQCLMPVSMVVKRGVDGEKVAGPVKGTFCDISAGGAAVITDTVALGGFHLVESTIEDPELVVEMEVNELPILCRPVWFHPVTIDGERKYRVGISFLRPPTEEELTEMAGAVEQEDERAGGLKGVVKKLLS